MPGVRCARSRACSVESTRVSHHGHTEITRHSPRNGFNGFLLALPGDRALLPPSPAKVLFRELDASVGASGPHDFSVRKLALSSAAPPASTASRPHVRDDRETPLRVGGIESQYSCFYLAVKRNSDIPKLVATQTRFRKAARRGKFRASPASRIRHATIRGCKT